MTHPVPANIIEDLILMHVQLGLVLTAMDVNSGISAAPGVSSPLIAAYTAMGSALLGKYTVTQINNIVCADGTFPPSHTGSVDVGLLFDHMYVIEDLLHG